MLDPCAFHELIRKVRARDEVGATELVRRYGPFLLLVIRHRLTDPRLKRVVDPTDICQTVLAAFFDRAARGRFRLDRPEHLRQLLATMARHEVTNQARKQCLGRRARWRGRAPLSDDAAAPGPDPSDIVADQELLDEFLRRLSADEQRLAEQHARGRSWHDIAAEIGGTADALRMRLVRALRRVAADLGLDPPSRAGGVAPA